MAHDEESDDEWGEPVPGYKAPPEPKPRKKKPPEEDPLDLEAAVAAASESPATVNQLEALLGKTPPELCKILEEEFGAQFLGPIDISPEQLQRISATKQSHESSD